MRILKLSLKGRMLGIAVISVLVLLFMQGFGMVTPNTTVSVMPAATSGAVGSTFDVTIDVADVVGLYGYQCDLRFDPALLEVDSVTEGPFLKEGGTSTFFNVGGTDNTIGLINDIACTRLSTINEVSGSGVLFTVKFKVKGVGADPIDLENLVLANGNSNQLNATVNNGNFDNQAPAAPQNLQLSPGTTTIDVSWDANSEPDLGGYKVYVGTVSEDYSQTYDVGNVTAHQLTGLSPGTYYIVVTAYDEHDPPNESEFSAQESAIVPSGLPVAEIISISPNPAVAGQDVTFMGQGNDPGNSIEAYSWLSDDVEIGTSATITTNALGVGTHVIKFKVRDNEGNWSAEDTQELVINEAEDPVTAPVITSPTSGFKTASSSIDVDGTSASGMTIMLFDGVDKIGETISDGTGLWSIDGLIMADGAHVLTATATNEDQATSGPSNAVNILIDSTPPGKPVISSPSPGIYNETGFDFIGTAEANAIVKLFEGQTEVGAGQADGNGDWSITVSGITDGVHNYTAKASDDLGNTGDPSDVLPLVIDTVAPDLAITSPADGAILNGHSFTVTGTCSDNGLEVVLDVDGEDAGTTTVSGNSWSKEITLSYGAHEIEAATEDTAGNASTDAVDVYVNMPPDVDAGADVSVIEGEEVSFSGAFTDGDEGDTHTIIWDFGDGSAATGTLVPTHTYADEGDYTVTLTIADNHGGESSDLMIVHVANAAPVVYAGEDQVINEGGLTSFTGSSTDAGIADTHTIKWDFGDGSTVSGTLNPSHTFIDNGMYTITLTVTDNDGGVGTDELTVIVNNIAPIVEAGADMMSVEGDEVSFSGNFLDPGVNDTHTIAWDFGDGTTASGSLAPKHAYKDDGVYTVELTVTDKDGGDNTDTLSVTVTNADPIASAGPDQTAAEGQDVSFAGSFTDPGMEDSHTIDWSFGDGSTASGSLTPSHAFSDNGVYTVTLTVIDDDGGVGTDTMTVTIDNVAPTVDAGDDQVVNEGATVTYSGSFTDPGEGDSHTYNWDFGDGVTDTGSLDTSHNYADNGVYTVTLTVEDDDGGVGTDTMTVTVNNVAPLPTAGPDMTVDEGVELGFIGSFVDPGVADTHTIEWNFGDGATASGILNPSHTYMDNGTYTVTLTITDDDGGVGTDTATITVNDLAPAAELSGDSVVDEGSTASYDASASTSYPDDIVAYDWDWDYNGAIFNPSGDTGAMQDHIYMDDGTYMVAVRVTDDDGSTSIASMAVTVNDLAPTAAFDWAPKPQDEGSDVMFSDLSTSYPDDIVAWSWNFGDGSASSDSDPVHKYGDNGIFDVTLTVTDDDGSTNSITHQVTIDNVAPTVDATAEDIAAGVQGLKVKYHGFFTDPGWLDTHTISWDFGDGSTASGSLDPEHAYSAPGAYIVTLTVEDDDHGIGTASFTVTVWSWCFVDPANQNKLCIDKIGKNFAFFVGGSFDKTAPDYSGHDPLMYSDTNRFRLRYLSGDFTLIVSGYTTLDYCIGHLDFPMGVLGHSIYDPAGFE